MEFPIHLTRAVHNAPRNHTVDTNGRQQQFHHFESTQQYHSVAGCVVLKQSS
jgi:hypothetical protein